MRVRSSSFGSAVVLLLLCTAARLFAQSATSSAPEAGQTALNSPLPVQSTAAFTVASALSYDELIWVTVGSSEPVKGRLRSWSDSTLEWNGPAGPVRTPLADLQRVEVRDPITDGAWKGALGGFAIGGTVGLLAAVGLSCERDCGEGYSRTRDIVSGAVGLGAFSAAGGAVLCTLTDMLVHRRRVAFERSPQARIVVLPPDPHTLGAALRLSW